MNNKEMFIQIGEDTYLNKYQIIKINKVDDCYEIITSEGKYYIYDTSKYYWNIVHLMR